MSEQDRKRKTLRECRMALGWTQRDLSEASGVTINTISEIERGNSGGSPPVMKALSEALGVEWGEIDWPIVERKRGHQGHQGHQALQAHRANYRSGSALVATGVA